MGGPVAIKAVNLPRTSWPLALIYPIWHAYSGAPSLQYATGSRPLIVYVILGSHLILWPMQGWRTSGHRISTVVWMFFMANFLTDKRDHQVIETETLVDAMSTTD